MTLKELKQAIKLRNIHGNKLRLKHCSHHIGNLIIYGSDNIGHSGLKICGNTQFLRTQLIQMMVDEHEFEREQARRDLIRQGVISL